MRNKMKRNKIGAALLVAFVMTAVFGLIVSCGTTETTSDSFAIPTIAP